MQCPPSTGPALVHILASPSLTEEIRNEAMAIAMEGEKRTDGKRETRIDITQFDEKYPVLVSVYRETIRLAAAAMGSRRAMKDTIISDGKTSHSSQPAQT